MNSWENKKEIDLNKARKFSEENGIREFFKVYREEKSNLSVAFE